MKSIFYFLPFLFLISCSPVLFESIDFVNDNTLESIPKELRGKYLSSDGDTLILGKKILELNSDPLSGDNNIDTLKQGSFEIAKFEDYYLLCKKDNDDHWSVVPLFLKNSTISVYLLDEDEYINNNLKDIKDENKQKEIFFSKLNIITPVKIKYDDPGEIDYYLINPTKKQFKELLKYNFFSKLDELNRIEK